MSSPSGNKKTSKIDVNLIILEQLSRHKRSINLNGLRLSSLCLYYPFNEVEELSIAHNKFIHLDDIIKYFPNITRLDISFNKLNSCDGLDKLRCLRVLNISGNPFQTFKPKSKSLETLIFKDAHVSYEDEYTIEMNLCGLKNLSKIITDHKTYEEYQHVLDQTKVPIIGVANHRSIKSNDDYEFETCDDIMRYIITMLLIVLLFIMIMMPYLPIKNIAYL